MRKFKVLAHQRKRHVHIGEEGWPWPGNSQSHTYLFFLGKTKAIPICYINLPNTSKYNNCPFEEYDIRTLT